MAINQDFQQQDFFSRTPRDVSKDVIDWSEITGKFVDFINIERDRRMAAKAEIDKNISTTLATMDNLDVGMDVDFNNFMFEGANNMRQYLLTQEKLLKSNQISVAEFKRNLLNTEGMVTNFKNYTTQYNEAVAKRDRMRMGVDEEGQPIDGGSILSRGDDWLMTHTGRYMDFGNAELVVGRDGSGGVVFTTGDPNRPYDVSSIQSMGNLLNLSQQMFTKYDVLGDVTGFVDELGKTSQGSYRRMITSQQLNEAYAPAKKDFIESIVSNPYKLQSIAADYLDVDIYEQYTTDESKMNDPNFLVFVTKDGYMQPAMNSAGWEKIKADAREDLSSLIDAQTDTEVKANRIPTDDKKDTLNNVYQHLSSFLATGNIEDLNSLSANIGLDVTVDDSGDDIIMTIGQQPYQIGRDGTNREQLFSGVAEIMKLGSKHSSTYRNYASGSYSAENMSGQALAPKPDGGSSSFGDSQGGGVGAAYIPSYSGVPQGLDRPAVNLGYNKHWQKGNNPKDQNDNNKQMLQEAFLSLSTQLGGSGNVYVVESGDNYVISHDGGDLEGGVIDKTLPKDEINQEIRRIYQANL